MSRILKWIIACRTNIKHGNSCYWYDLGSSFEVNQWMVKSMSRFLKFVFKKGCQGPSQGLNFNLKKLYAVCDIINGFRLGPTYLAHGVATFSVATAFNELGASHVLTPMLIMEVSTMVLAVLRADFFTPTMQLLSQASFALLFFITRIIMSPVILYQIISTMLYHMAGCFPNSVFWLTFVFGAFFTSLNVFCKWILLNARTRLPFITFSFIF